jgi:iron-sulfur cluster repair protein YtfE (RIC family)
MAYFEQLMREHDGLEALARDLLTRAGASETDISEIVEVRTRLAVSLANHLAKEDGAIYPQLVNHGDYQVAQIARRFIDEFADIATVWGNYLDHWTADRIAGDLAAFQDVTTAVITRLRDRIAMENAQLYPLALRLGAIELRAA